MLFSNPFRSDSESDDTNTALPYSYRPLSDETGPTVAPAKGRRPIRVIVLLLTGLLAVGLLVALMSGDGLASNGGSEMVSASVSTTNMSTSPGRIKPVARGIKEGVSAKSFVPLLGVPQFPWTREIPLSDETGPTVAPAKGRRPIRVIVLLLTGLLAVGLLVALMSGDGLASNGGSEMVSASVSTTNMSTSPGRIKPVSRGIKEGVSAKSFVPLLGVPQFPWTREMLAWQRTAFHFQPKKNWMNGMCFIFHAI
ncbi:unnamed protein product [Ilex paraguariensis]|uniref:beta-fructofuranosidase n=1 Tax=Ilex paraguariensis TaxID=185542 RepID=A0ABC8RPU3_9AQUA